MKNNFCCVCLENNEDLHLITKRDFNNCSIATKLQICVSEIEWKENYVICLDCSNKLQLFYDFRQKCISLEDARQQLVKIENDTIEPEINQDNKTNNCEEKTEKLTFNCEFCDTSFRYGKTLVTHCVDRHQVDPKTIKPYPCHLCTARFPNAQYLLKHLIYHKDERKFICTFCGKSYKTKNDLNIHERIHLNKRDYKCETCDKTFNTHKSLRTHKLAVHTDPNLWKHVCQICLKRFPMKGNLDTHLRRHNNERPFKCHLCDKNFVDKCTLQKHIRSHSNNRDYSCDICNKLYKEKRIMEIHKKKCHGIGDIKIPERVKKFLCHLCPKSYFAQNKLRRHLLTHSGEKPYLCQCCQKKFVDGTYLKQHLKRVHNYVQNEET